MSSAQPGPKTTTTTITSTTALLAEVLDERVEFSLLELCRASRADEAQVRVWVLQGVLTPLAPRASSPAQEWRFSGSALRRATQARRLAQDLEINSPGVALALELMDEIEALKASLRRAGLG